MAVEKQAVAKAIRKKLNEKVVWKNRVITISQIRAKIQKLNNKKLVKL